MKKRPFLTAGLLFLLLLRPLPVDAAPVPSPASKEGPASSLMIADFETGEQEEKIKNNLGAESGSWNLNPADENNSYTDPDIVAVTGTGKGDKTSKALRLNYSVESELPSQNGFWTKLTGLDASGYDHLQLDVKGDERAGFTERFKIELKKFKEGSTVEKIKGSAEILVTSEWQTVSIPLNRMTGLLDFSDPKVWQDPSVSRKNLEELVVVFQDRYVTAKKGVIYLDNIRFVRTGSPGPSAVDFPPRAKEKTPTRIEGLEFAKFLMKRLGGFPKTLSVKKEFPKDDRDFLKEIAKDTWRFFDEIVDQEHGLPLDTIQLGKTEAVGEGTWIGDYTNVTNIGLYLMSLVSACDLGFLNKEEAVSRIRLVFAALEKVEYHASGFPYNYYDTTTLERTSYFVSLVDSGWLVAGLYVVKNAFPEELKDAAQKLIDRGDFVFFYDPVERQMHHGYYAHLQVYSDYHYGVFYTEPRTASYIAIASGQVPEEHWYEGLLRTFPPEFKWQAQAPKDRVERTTRGHKYFGGYYEWRDLKYVPSWGGSAFEALMPTLVLNEKDLAGEGLGLNDKRHAEGQVRYALEELKMPVWGMSPSSVPEGGYSEFGARPFGSKGYKAGVVTPHASVLGLEFVPEEALRNLRKLIELYDSYGEYGFYDAVSPATGLVAKKYLSLDQAMILIAIDNYLNDGAIRKRFHADPVMKKGESLLSEKFFSEAASGDSKEEDASSEETQDDRQEKDSNDAS